MKLIVLVTLLNTHRQLLFIQYTWMGEFRSDQSRSPSEEPH